MPVKAANALIWRFASVRFFTPRLPLTQASCSKNRSACSGGPPPYFSDLKASTKRRLDGAMRPVWVAPSSVHHAA